MLRRLWGWFAKLEEAQFNAIKVVFQDHEYRLESLEAPQGLSADPILPLRLDVVAVAAQYSPAHMVTIQNYLQHVRRFYLGQGVWLRVGVRVLTTTMPMSIDATSPWMDQHWQRGGGDDPTIYVNMDVDELDNGHLGDAVPGPYCNVALVAGADATITPKVMVHELGHLLGLRHEEGTFMRAGMGSDTDEVVTPAQRQGMRDAL